jgi:hypothetical protein
MLMARFHSNPAAAPRRLALLAENAYDEGR